MTEALERECEVFARYLSGASPSEYVLKQYLAAHAAGVVLPPGGASRFDEFVVGLARRGAWLARALDAHARVFANGSLLRRKLVLMLALLEVRSPHAEALDTPTGSSRALMLVAMAWLGVRFALSVVLAALLLLPARIVLGGGGAK